MKYNPARDLAGGLGQYHNSLKLASQPARYIHPLVDGGEWIDTDTLISRHDGLGCLVKFVRKDTFSSFTPLELTNGTTAPPGNAFCAGGANWATTIQAGVYTTVGVFNNGPLPDQFTTGHLVSDCSRDGSLLFLDIITGTWVVLWHDGAIENIGPGLEACVGEGHRALLWTGSQLKLFTTAGVEIVPTLVPSGLYKLAIAGDWISYASDRSGRVIHKHDSFLGFDGLPLGYSPTLFLNDTSIYIAITSGPAELPNEIQETQCSLADARVLIPPPVPVPVFPTGNYSVWAYDEPGSKYLTWVGDPNPVNSGCFGVYTEMRDDPAVVAQKAIASHLPVFAYRDGAWDATADAFVASLYSHGVTLVYPTVNCYPGVDYHSGIDHARRTWGHLACTLAFYTQFNPITNQRALTIDQCMTTALDAVTIANGYRAEWFLCYIWTRANNQDGIVAFPQFQQMLANLRSSALGAPVVPPEPHPIPPTIPPPVVTLPAPSHTEMFFYVHPHASSQPTR